MRLIASSLSCIIFYLVANFSAHALQVRSLNENNSIPLTNQYIQNSVWFFFKPHCAICIRQVREFDCLERSIKKVAVGFGASRFDLLKTSKKMSLKKMKAHLTLNASDELLRFFAIDKKISPQLILFKNGKAIKYLKGFTKCTKLNSLLAD